MSVRLNSSADNLAATVGIVLGAGDWVVEGWLKPINLPGNGVEHELFTLATDVAGSAAVCIHVYLWGDDDQFYLFDGATYSIEGDVGTGVTADGESWYFFRLMRNGDSVTLAVFPDSTSTTPLGTATLTGFTGDNLDTLDVFVIGNCLGNAAFDGEAEDWRYITGVTQTNAQTRAESQSYDYVLGTGTIQGNWRLKDADADADGTDDSSVANHDLANTGCVSGASTPAQLGGGGGGPAAVMIPSRNVAVFGGR